MKNIYHKNFLKYMSFVQSFSGETYIDLIDEVSKVIVPKCDKDDEKNAIVLFGFSGNGKSTWIKNFCAENPEYEVLSMDSVVSEKEDELGRRIEGMEITSVFSKAFDDVCSRSKNIIVDGNFLNLLTRMCLADSFHMLGYNVTVMDITPIFDITIESRIMDEASKVLGTLITLDNVEQFRNNPTYMAVEKHVRDFHKDERERASYDEQIVAGGVSVGVEKVITVNSTPKQDNISGKKM